MPDHEFEYHPEAIQEATAAFHWYDERSPAAAEDFWQELRSARQSVTQQPDAGSAYLHGTKCRRLKRFPYGLIYTQRAERVIGIAVAHLKRRPGYWRQRLAE